MRFNVKCIISQQKTVSIGNLKEVVPGRRGKNPREEALDKSWEILLTLKRETVDSRREKKGIGSILKKISGKTKFKGYFQNY